MPLAFGAGHRPGDHRARHCCGDTPGTGRCHHRGAPGHLRLPGGTPRLAPAEEGQASEFLVRHKEQAAAAEERLLSACGAPVPQQPGYVLDPGFLAAPAAGLGKLEAATLAAYGDVVAVSQGQDRQWAMSALQSAAGRAMRWGADPGPVPGLALDAEQLPALPAGARLPASAGPTTSPTAS
ncbi:DUF4439 domain-containing protein [Arthrobacter sp. FX8]|uniref:DUF4439 domain-containing protein n=1 Tax=Arthrobacter sp. FX8 TaxID=2997335 RepID=UPI002DD6AFD5|nr:DUF4439 domain-containing protein [Arthrobacter sp. FX8]